MIDRKYQSLSGSLVIGIVLVFVGILLFPVFIEFLEGLINNLPRVSEEPLYLIYLIIPLTFPLGLIIFGGPYFLLISFRKIEIQPDIIKFRGIFSRREIRWSDLKFLEMKLETPKPRGRAWLYEKLIGRYGTLKFKVISKTKEFTFFLRGANLKPLDHFINTLSIYYGIRPSKRDNSSGSIYKISFQWSKQLIYSEKLSY